MTVSNPTARRRFIFAAVAITFALYFTVGHGSHQTSDGMQTMHGAGVCLVLVAAAAALGAALVHRLPPQLRLLPFVLIAPPPAVVAPTPISRRARASPQWLQQFRC